jgi:hypothetical protein
MDTKVFFWPWCCIWRKILYIAMPLEGYLSKDIETYGTVKITEN